MTVSNAGYFISNTEIPLDQLNTPVEPPTESAGSPFSPIPSLSGPLAPGANLSSDVSPEPGTALLVVTGLMGLALGCRPPRDRSLG